MTDVVKVSDINIIPQKSITIKSSTMMIKVVSSDNQLLLLWDNHSDRLLSLKKRMTWRNDAIKVMQDMKLINNKTEIKEEHPNF